MRAIGLFAVLAWTDVTMAQSPMPTGTAAPVAGMKPGVQSFVPLNPSVAAANEAMSKMMADMSKPYSGDADQDFVSHMIPHHQGAIDMAEIELKYGNDPKLKQLAGRVIAAQQREIAFMQAWQAKHKMVAGPQADDPRIQSK